MLSIAGTFPDPRENSSKELRSAVDTSTNISDWELLEAMADGAAVIDSPGSMVFVTQGLASLLGYEQSELIGREVEVLLDGKARRSHRNIRSGFVNDPRTRPMGIGLKIEARCKDGTLIPVDVQLRPFGSNGLVVASVRDLRASRDLDELFKEVSEREREGRALLDLVVQRLFGIAASLAAVSSNMATENSDGLTVSGVLIEETIRLIRSVSLESPSKRENLAGLQSELLLRDFGP